MPLAALVFCGGALWSVTLLLLVRNGGAKFALPFLIYALTLAVLIYAPLQQIALQQNFHWHRQNRERIVARVEAGELKPNVDYNKNLIALGAREPNVSARGNDIVVDETEEGTYVLFLTSRGLKHYFTGFLRVPPGGDPNKFFEFEDKPPSQLVRYDERWYFVASWATTSAGCSRASTTAAWWSAKRPTSTASDKRARSSCTTTPSRAARPGATPSSPACIRCARA